MHPSPLRRRTVRAALVVGSVPATLLGRLRRVRLGTDVPLRHGLLYVPPWEITHLIDRTDLPTSPLDELLGRIVRSGDWDLQARTSPLGRKSRALEGLVQGLGPVRSGYVAFMQREIAEFGSRAGCRTTTEILERAGLLEEMIEDMRRTGRMRTRAELDRWAFRERTGVGVAIGRDGTLMKTKDGGHRLALARALDLPAVPTATVAVHPDALRNGSWERLARRSAALAPKVQADADLT